MKNLFCPLYLFIVTVCLSACSGTVGRTETEAVLSQAASEMGKCPDLALSILDTLDRSRLCSRKLIARHSLLYSQALEKNDILLETDSVIAPAVKYYKRHGSPDERLLTQYYLGCIRWNAGNLDEALDCFLRAEQYAGKAKDYQAVGRLYSAMKSIYYEVYEFPRSFDCSLKAAEYYAMSGDSVLQGKSLIMAVDVAMLMEDNSSADSILNYIHDTLWNGLCISQRGRYYLSKVVRYQDSYINEAMNNLYAYLRTVTDIEDREWGLVSRAYLLAGKVDSARWALDYYPAASADYEKSTQYWLLQHLVSKAEGKYRDATLALEQYVSLVDKEDMAMFRQDTRFVEERYQNEIQRLRLRYSVLLLSVLGVMAILISAYVLHRYREKLKFSEAEIVRLDSVLKNEKEKLEFLSDHAIDEKSVQSIQNVLSLLTLISLEKERSLSEGSITDSLKLFLKDKNALTSVMLASYSLTDYEFVQNLRMKGLSDREIGYCCLYASGLSGKDISAIFGSNSHYNIASKVRSKIGLKEREANLAVYIKSLLSIKNETKVGKKSD